MTGPLVPSRAVRIVHTTREGTVLSGTRYGDGCWSILVYRGAWEWRRDSRTYLLRGSVGGEPDVAAIRWTCRRLRSIGVQVSVVLDFT